MSEASSEGTIDPEEARVKLARREVVAIDLRDADTAAGSHAPGAVIVGDEEPEQAVERARGEDGDKPVIVFCEDGSDSGEVAAKLCDAGIEAAAVEGGWAAWQKEGMPIQPGEDEEYEGPDLSTQPGQ